MEKMPEKIIKIKPFLARWRLFALKAGKAGRAGIASVLIGSVLLVGKPAHSDKTPSPPPLVEGENLQKEHERFVITKRGDHIVIKTQVNEIDLRPVLSALFQGAREEGKAREAPQAPAPKKPEETQEAEQGKLRILDVDIDIKKMLLLHDVTIENGKSFFVYQDNRGGDDDANLLSFVDDLSGRTQKKILFGMQNLDFNGALNNRGYLTPIRIRIAPLNEKTKSILVRSSDANGMMKVIGFTQFEGEQYVLSAQWTQGETKEKWSVEGWIELKDFYVNQPPLTVRFIGAFFSFSGFFSALTGEKVFFRKMKFFFNATNEKANIECRIFFGDTNSVSCGSFDL